MGVTFLTQLVLLVGAIACVHAQQDNASSSHNATHLVATTAGVVRRLDSTVAPGNIAACYTPFHNWQYPLRGGNADVDAIRRAIDDDFRLLSQHFTHVRTYYSMHYGIEVAPIAAKYGLKLFLGVFLTKESWGVDETNAAVNAIKKYSDTVEVVSVGSENLVNFMQRSGDILAKINEIKSKAGSDAWRVKYATVQRANEFLESKYDWDMQQLSNNLDILGVNIYPFFDNGYNGNNPTKILDDQWNRVLNKWPRDKIVLTETGFPTAGAPSWLSPNVIPSLDASVQYYNAVVNWSPAGYETKQKYWFQAFDRRAEDPAATPDLERYFGFYTTDKSPKRANFPLLKGASTARSSSSASSSTCMIEEGVDYNGNDIGNVPSTTADGCFSACNKANGCGAFTWTNYSGGTCWLKASKGATSANGQARSGVACKCNLGGLEPGVDYAGNDIANVLGADAQQCIAHCQKHAGCRAFTWSDYYGGTCWLKSGKATTRANGSVTSGVICA